MNFIGKQDVHDLIKEIGVPCKDAEALWNDLNYWIFERGYLSDKLPLNSNQQKKYQEEISHKNEILHGSRLGCLEGALNTIIFHSEIMPFFKQVGIEEHKIEHAKEVLEALIKYEAERAENVPMDLADFEEVKCLEKRHSPRTVLKGVILPGLYEKYFGDFKDYVSSDHQKMSSGIHFAILVLKKSAGITITGDSVSAAYKRLQKRKGH